MGSMTILPTIPAVRTRSPASDHLIHHFLDNGWLGQVRPKGVLLKISVGASGKITTTHANTTSLVNQGVAAILQSKFRPASGLNAYLAIREQGTKRIWIVDCLLSEGLPMTAVALDARLRKIPKDFISPTLKVATPIATSQAVHKAIEQGHNLLFRHPTMPGWRQEGMVILTAPKEDS